MSIPFVNVDGFTPNLGQWTPVGAISSVVRAGNTFTLALQSGGRSLQASFLSPTCFRIRFNPAAGASYASEISPAVVTRSLGSVNLVIRENSPGAPDRRQRRHAGADRPSAVPRPCVP